jgi:hypothetical protein
MPWLLYLQKRAQVILGGIQSWSGCFGEEKDLLILLGIEPSIVQPKA